MEVAPSFMKISDFNLNLKHFITFKTSLPFAFSLSLIAQESNL